MIRTFTFAFFLLLSGLSLAHDWTYNVAVSNGGGGAKKKFYLWLPASAQGVRGVILTAQARLSQLSGDSTIRKACKLVDVGIMGCPEMDGGFNPADSAYIKNALLAFAQASKFPELEHVALGSYGTSVGGIFAWDVAYAFPDRFFGIIQDNAIYTTKPGWNAGRSITHIPLLVSRGAREVELSQVGDRWFLSRDSVLSQRHKGSPASMIVQAGTGHFSWTHYEAKYIAKWIEKAANARIPQEYMRQGRLPLLPVNMTTGWLSDTTFSATDIVIGSFPTYTEDPTNAFFHFDEELATMWKEMHLGMFQRASTTGQFNNGTFENCQSPWQDCQPAFSVCAGAIDPQAVTNGALPIRYGVYNGPFELDNGIIKINEGRIDDSPKGWIYAVQEGNATRQGWERAVRFNVTKVTSGTDQTISFTPIADKPDTLTSLVPFTASATSGQPVKATVISGPVTVVGNALKIQPFAGDSAAGAQCVIRYTQACAPGFKTAQAKTDTFLVFKTKGIVLGNKSLKKSGTESLYPNPANQTVYWSGAIPETAVLSDVLGRELGRISGEVLVNGFSISHLQKGVYILQYQLNGNQKSLRLVKE